MGEAHAINWLERRGQPGPEGECERRILAPNGCVGVRKTGKSHEVTNGFLGNASSDGFYVVVSHRDEILHERFQ